MKHKVAMFIGILLTGYASLVSAQGNSSSDDANHVRDILQKNVAGFEHGDFLSIESLWAHGDDVTVIENGRENYGWSDFRDHHLKPELEHVKNLKYTLSDIRVTVSGTMAWSTFKFAMSSGDEGARRERSGVGTAVLEKRADGWKIVHWNSSTPRTNGPPPSATAKPQ
jgi:ketosteroid isomerase-like protein